MSGKIEASKLRRIFILLFLLLYSFIIENSLINRSLEDNIITGFFALIIPCYAFLIYSALKEKRKLGFMLEFIVLSIIFYYGQYFLIVGGFYEDLSRKYVSLICGRIEIKYVIRAFYIHIRAMLILMSGYLISYRNEEKGVNRIQDKQSIAIPNGFGTVAIVLFVVSGICQIVVLLYNLSIGNYLELRSIDSEIYRFSSGNILFYFAYLSKWFLPSTYMLLLQYAIKGETKKYRIVLLFLAGYIFLYLLTGARFSVLKAITAVFIIHNSFVRKITKRDLKWILPFSVFLIILFSIMSGIRTSGVSIEGIIDALKSSNPHTIIYNVLSEAGGSSTPLANTMQYCPSFIPHKYFEFILKCMCNALPSFINPIYDISIRNTSSYFSPLLYGYSGTGYGSSFIAEAYFYWGSFMYIIIFLYGIFIGILDKRFDQISKIQDITKIYAAIFIFSEMIFWVRSDVFEIGRSIIYYVIFPLLLVKLLSKAKSLYNQTPKQ